MIERKILRLAVLFSGNASAVQELEHSDPGWGWDYEVVVACTDRSDTQGRKFFETQGVPCFTHHFRSWCENAGIPSRGDPEHRSGYFNRLADEIDAFVPDYIVLSGFTLILPRCFVTAFHNRILNVHPADLSVHDTATRQRRYVGPGRQAIARTIWDKCPSVRATVHFVTEAVDAGEIVAFSDECRLESKADAALVQSRMKKIADPVALARALHILATKKQTD